nr:MAG TPA: hypothetical protein [Caudoviricetes sp.]
MKTAPAIGNKGIRPPPGFAARLGAAPGAVGSLARLPAPGVYLISPRSIGPRTRRARRQPPRIRRPPIIERAARRPYRVGVS